MAAWSWAVIAGAAGAGIVCAACGSTTFFAAAGAAERFLAPCGLGAGLRAAGFFATGGVAGITCPAWGSAGFAAGLAGAGFFAAGFFADGGAGGMCIFE
jgi:hypothetical protein